MRPLAERPFIAKPPPSADSFFTPLIASLTKLLGEVIQRSNASITNDGATKMIKPFVVQSATVAELSALPAASWTAGVIFVSDEAGGATLAVSDGTNWKRVQDLATVS